MNAVERWRRPDGGWDEWVYHDNLSAEIRHSLATDLEIPYAAQASMRVESMAIEVRRTAVEAIARRFE